MAKQYGSGIDFARSQEAKILELIRTNKPLREAVYNDMAAKSVRIFENGQKSNGSQIGTYATSPPMYVNPNFAPRKGTIRVAGGGKLEGLLPTRGKPTPENPQGERFFTEQTKHRGVPGTKAGDPHRTTYLDGGYKELRNRTGRRVDRVNLRFTNDLFLDWANANSLATKPSPEKVSEHEYVIRLKREHNIDKRVGLEDKYGVIFDSTKGERVNFLNNLQERINKFLNS